MASETWRLSTWWRHLRLGCIRQGARRRWSSAAIHAPKTRPAGRRRSVAEPPSRLLRRAGVSTRPCLPRSPPDHGRQRRRVGRRTRLLSYWSPAWARLWDRGRRLHNSLPGTSWRRSTLATRADADRHAVADCRRPVVRRRKSLSGPSCRGHMHLIMHRLSDWLTGYRPIGPEH